MPEICRWHADGIFVVVFVCYCHWNVWGRKLFNSNVVLESRNSFSSQYVPGDLASHEHPLGVWCYIYAVTIYIGSTLLGNGKCIHPYSKDSKHVDVL